MPSATSAPTGHLPLTAAQRGIWYAQHLDPDNPTYQIGQFLDLRGPIDPALLNLALTKAATDLDALSLRIGEDAAGPYAEIHRPRPTADLVRVRDLRHLGPDAAEDAAHLDMDQEMSTPRDMHGDDLLGATLYLVDEDRSLFFLRVHHIQIDGYSAVIALRYIAETYSRLARVLPGSRLPRRLAPGVAHVLARLPSPLPSLAALQRDLEAYESSPAHRGRCALATGLGRRGLLRGPRGPIPRHREPGDPCPGPSRRPAHRPARRPSSATCPRPSSQRSPSTWPG